MALRSLNFRSSAQPAPMQWRRFADRAEFLAGMNGTELRRQRAVEQALAGGHPFAVRAHCWICQEQVDLRVDYTYSYRIDGVLTPNWREHLLCPGCQLNNRMRATIHFLEDRVEPEPGASIYVTEQTTPLFHRLSARHERVTGSEYLGAALQLGDQDSRGIRNESVTRLTFAAEAFDHVVCLDVLEHVPDYRRGLAECHRVLRPGGTLLLSVPFRSRFQENLVRAVMDDRGEVRHLLPPEYHGDPLRDEGCLAFYCFGWEFLDDVRAAHFEDVAGYQFWSRDHGYLGPDLILFLARKPEH